MKGKVRSKLREKLKLYYAKLDEPNIVYKIDPDLI